MDSSKWSEQKKLDAGGKFANRMHRLLQSPTFRAEARRNKVATDLSIALAESQMTRQAVADKAGIKLSQLSRQLSGDVNLTLDSIGKICEAMGYEFDMVLRKTKDKAALQPWQQRLNRASLVQLVNETTHSKNSFKSPNHKWQTTPICLKSTANSQVCSPSNDEEFSHELEAA